MAFRRSRVRSASAPPIKSRLFAFSDIADKGIVRILSAFVKSRSMSGGELPLRPGERPFKGKRDGSAAQKALNFCRLRVGELRCGIYESLLLCARKRQTTIM